MSPSTEATILLALVVGAWMFWLGYMLGKARATARQPLTDRMSFED
ncbi:hypothetical protein [Methylobacterium fujisawaense]